MGKRFVIVYYGLVFNILTFGYMVINNNNNNNNHNHNHNHNHHYNNHQNTHENQYQNQHVEHQSMGL